MTNVNLGVPVLRSTSCSFDTLGPTLFAPIIEMAMTIIENSGGQYHVLLIIADGQVTRSVETEPGRLSPQEQRTISAIVRERSFPLVITGDFCLSYHSKSVHGCSEFLLSIILVGVGDGPWDMMREFDDSIPARALVGLVPNNNEIFHCENRAYM
ncbi:hypothetical protein MLD38_002346 [Melastoma candidum]|uniref:Uncharacterized protein n=1 Tax=Melastoma candidum TaxID=119954 RepID=A0ACB9S0K3_9MYRT|nr:hypothetical protein MLD38_002346 [Melastoma candidum]